MNSAVRLIFNENFGEKRGLWSRDPLEKIEMRFSKKNADAERKESLSKRSFNVIFVLCNSFIKRYL